MITIADILHLEDIDLELKMTNQEEAINHIASLLKEDDRVTDWSAFYKGLASVQPCLSAAGGTGVCIPHTRTQSVTGMVMSAGRSRAGIAIRDGQGPVHFVFVIGVPVALAADYLRIIGALARIFKDPATREKLMQTQEAEEFLQLLASAEMKL
jgi:mannitol/fructose-specific phosphotransferase system IIA component (Ntr-type)